MMLGPLMILVGAVWLLLACAKAEVGRAQGFFGVSDALRAIYPTPMFREPDPDLIEILGEVDMWR